MDAQDRESVQPHYPSKEEAQAFLLETLGHTGEGMTPAEIEAALRETDWYKQRIGDIEAWRRECEKLDRWWHTWMPHLKDAKQMRELLRNPPT